MSSSTESRRRTGDAPVRRLTLAQARRLAIASQGFGRPQPSRVGMRDVQSIIDEVAEFQIDSVNVMERAAYMPLFSRLGPYDKGLLDRANGSSPRRLFEYWGHAACLIDVNLEPALRWRMATKHAWSGVERVRRERPELLDEVRDAVLARPRGVTARELDASPRVRTEWGWNWTDTRRAAELLFNAGDILSLRRNASFERVYAARDRVVPTAVLARETPDVAVAKDILMRRALHAQGIAQPGSLASYVGMGTADARAALGQALLDGSVEPCEIEGLPGTWYLDPTRETVAASRPPVNALVSPFDSLMFDRERIERLFGFRYRIEIYVPAPQRRYGYYVYPFLMGDAFAARVDLKADRAAGVLRVRSAWLEDGHEAGPVSRALASELGSLAAWQGLSSISVDPVGTLAGRLAIDL